MQRRVMPAARDQLAMRALLDDAARVEHDDAVGVFDRRQPVRDDQRRAVAHEALQRILDEKTEPWGITVQSVEIRDVKIPQGLEDAMSRQAQAERERQARIILGMAETEIADNFAQAAATYADNRALFRYDTRSRQKVNLLVFLKPTVVRTDAQGKAISNERYEYIMRQQLDSRPEYRYFWNDQTAPVLPPFGQTPTTIEGVMPSNVTQPGAPQPPIPPTWPLGPPIGTQPQPLQVPSPPGAPPAAEPPK